MACAAAGGRARAAIAWLKRQITFENQRLGEVADEFNRYGHIAIEIDDETLPLTIDYRGVRYV